MRKLTLILFFLPLLTPANITTAALTAAQVYPAGTTTNFSLISNVTALTAATQYSWYYHVGAD